MIDSYESLVIDEESSLSLARLVGHLTAIVIENKDRFARYPEESRNFFIEVFGQTGGMIAFSTYLHMLIELKERKWGPIR